jgi:GAF domain-containing protein
MAADGTRQLYYYQPVRGRSWSIILTVPAREIQQQALGMAAPLMVAILAIAVVVLVILFLGLRVVTGSLVALSGEAALIAQGQFDHPLPPTEAVDESGQLRRAFEQMRVSLKARLEELNRLLQVSQGVASSLEIRGALKPILEAALSNHASAARVVLAEDIILEPRQDGPSRFGFGEACDMYAYLDSQVLALTRQAGVLALPNLTRARGLNIPTRPGQPNALIAVALRHENRFYGVLWVGYDQSRNFTEEEVRFLNTLAGQAALAAANARLYATAEVGRQRLEAILASTPEPVLVTDHQDRLMLTNPAAMQLPGMNRLTTAGQPVREVDLDSPR